MRSSGISPAASRWIRRGGGGATAAGRRSSAGRGRTASKAVRHCSSRGWMETTSEWWVSPWRRSRGCWTLPASWRCKRLPLRSDRPPHAWRRLLAGRRDRGVGPTMIKCLRPEDRPRERLLRGGPEGLSSPELLALLLQTGTPTADVSDLAGRLLVSFGSL